ncbi:MAG: NO-inducible flavohemoprotein [Phycisphaerales bacterium]
MLSMQTRDVVKQTIPVLKEHGEALTRHFYGRMFTQNPEVKAFFNPAHQHAGTQQKALAAAILAYAENIDNPANLAEAIELIAHKHASLGVKAEHYPIVGKHLLGSIKDLLGDAATDEVLTAWGEAYALLADVCIERESRIYDEHEQDHGWTGFRRFIIERIERESDTISSFYLTPEDGKPLAPFQAGQYITIRMPLPDGGTTMRNYSLSLAPSPTHYRISVKREGAEDDANPAGYVSHQLHRRFAAGQALEVGPPCGNFVLSDPTSPEIPLVLVSGGVGITPLLAMLHEAIQRWPDREIVFIHGALNSRTHAFGDEVRALAASRDRLRVHFRYSDPLEDDLQSQRAHSAGVPDTALVRTLTPSPGHCEYYFCGPFEFMNAFDRTLDELSVPTDCRHNEFFGPARPSGCPACQGHPA